MKKLYWFDPPRGPLCSQEGLSTEGRSNVVLNRVKHAQVLLKPVPPPGFAQGSLMHTRGDVIFARFTHVLGTCLSRRHLGGSGEGMGG